MNRDYLSGKSDTATYFSGIEVEHTPAYGLKTLFVVGLQPISDVAKQVLHRTDIKHIFFGANHSFGNIQSGDEFRKWQSMIAYFLDKGYLCSLDIPLADVESFVNTIGLNECASFIPQIRVPIPHVDMWNYNTMIKIDDKDFNYSNPGVWAHSLHDLKDRKCFTPWGKYKDDNIIK